ncbi:hypothetical protein A9404_07900 [Halothiobacillus diazotrophicus]|uniref:POTRA domain-containing protein n=1 Tax=Halothiobacillus diazotrophicus TaxID=1860122 RepID=A0A191ZKI4_9GAMM|nr:hypothetical protein A9404_07900 [Halothiobacillus diazotrophicus]
MVFSPSKAFAAPATGLDEQTIRQLQQERALRAQQEPPTDVQLKVKPTADAGRIPDHETPCFVIRQIDLVGDSAKSFSWALSAANADQDPAIGRCLGAKGIGVVMQRIQNALIARGYITTRVLAGAQNLRSGILHLTLVPGRVGRVRFAEGTSPRAHAWNALPLESGDVLNLRDIEQGLENFKRVPTADADMQIVPGAKPGESDVLIHWRQSYPLRLSLFVDDAGSKETGRYQGGAILSYDNWLTLNDLFYLSVNRSLGLDRIPSEHGTSAYTIHYSVPFGYWGLGVTSSESQYRQSIAGANQSYVYRGKNHNQELKLSRLMYRDAVRKLTLSASTYLTTAHNYIDDTEIVVQRRRMAGFKAAVAYRQFIGRATLDFEAAYRWGTGARGAIPAPESAFGEGTAKPRIETAALALNVPFEWGAEQLRYRTEMQAQWSQTVLIPQDRFAIGGRYTVRGFSGESLLSAEHGLLIRNDLGLVLGPYGELYIGVDYGQVSGPSARWLPGKRLAGGVLGVRGGFKGLSYDVFAGHAIAKPAGFPADGMVAGFRLGWTF